MSLEGIYTAIQATVGAITGIRSAPVYPPENLSGIFPSSVVYSPNGILKAGPGYGTYEALYNIKIELHFGRADLPKEVEWATPFGLEVGKVLLADPSIGGSCETFDHISYYFGTLNWGEPPISTIGWALTLMNVKEVGSLT